MSGQTSNSFYVPQTRKVLPICVWRSITYLGGLSKGGRGRGFRYGSAH